MQVGLHRRLLRLYSVRSASGIFAMSVAVGTICLWRSCLNNPNEVQCEAAVERAPTHNSAPDLLSSKALDASTLQDEHGVSLSGNEIEPTISELGRDLWDVISPDVGLLVMVMLDNT